MKREIVITEDGSTSIHLPEWGESYHSKHGAIQEAYHVFIKNGLSLFEGRPVSILEIGFGTGLNALVTLLEARRRGMEVWYEGVEAYPVNLQEAIAMNYPAQLSVDGLQRDFELMHTHAWEIPMEFGRNFTLTKRRQFFDEISDESRFDLIYFDAFGYRVQPELWSADIFKAMFLALKPQGVVVTYAARGIIRKNMEAAGFTVEKLAGPPGKREMFRARK